MPTKKITPEDIDAFTNKVEELEKIKLTPEDIDEINVAIRDFIIEKNQNNNDEEIEAPKVGQQKIKYRFR